MRVKRVGIVIVINAGEVSQADADKLSDKLSEVEEEQDKIIDVVGELLKPFRELQGDYIIEHPSFIITP